MFILVGLLLFSLSSFAAGADFGIYGIQSHEEIDAYQQYIGETVIYMPRSVFSSADKRFRRYRGKFDVEYVIIDISIQRGVLVIDLREKDRKRKVRYRVSSLKTYSSEFPALALFLVDKFKNDKNTLIGSRYADTRLGKEYELTDIRLKPATGGEEYPQVYYVVKNLTYDDTVEIPVQNAMNGQYVSSLVQVVKPANETIRHGETKIIENDSVAQYGYVDDHIDILIFGSPKGFHFLLKNISSNTLKLIWNEAVFVDFDGTSSKVMHSGIKYSEKDGNKPASVIISGASIDDIAIPTSIVKHLQFGSIINEWIIDTMYPGKPRTSPGLLRLMLPIEVKETVNEYIFVFEVEWIFDYPQPVT